MMLDSFTIHETNAAIDSSATKEVPLDANADLLLNGGVEAA